EAPGAEFRVLIGQLVGQHEADIRSAVAALQQENRSLREEVSALRGAQPRWPAGAHGGGPVAPRASSRADGSTPVTSVGLSGSATLPILSRSVGQADGEPAARVSSAAWSSKASSPARVGTLPGALHASPEVPRLDCGGSTLAQELSGRSEERRPAAGEEPLEVLGATAGRPRPSQSSLEPPGASARRRRPSRRSSLGGSSVVPSARSSIGGTPYSPLNVRISATEVTRFSRMLHVDKWNTGQAKISARDLLRVLESRGVEDLSIQRVSWVMQRLLGVSSPEHALSGYLRDRAREAQFLEVRPDRSDDDDADFEMPFKAFVDIMLCKNISKGLSPEVAEEARCWQKALMTETIEEVIDRLAKSGSPEACSPSPEAWSKSRMWASRSSVRSTKEVTGYRERCKVKALPVLNAVVVVTVFVSVISLSLSMDYCIDCEAWFYVEMIAALIFVTELLIKFCIFGYAEFLFGDDWMWNWSDASITIVDFLEVGMRVLVRTGDVDIDQTISVGTVLVALRTLRILRFARLVKMARSPLLHELASILHGFVLGSRALLWVLMVIWIVLWVTGATFRQVIGPKAGQELLTDWCGFDGDTMHEAENAAKIEMFPECGSRHRLYADEYCSTVVGCSFTVFRCMIGDCSSKGGQSLPAHFSAGYKIRFDLIYVFGMIVLIFGLFNIIQRLTAVFVESTMKGLAAQDTRIKRQEKYQVKHVRRALERLVRRITVISDTYKRARDHGEAQRKMGSFNRLFGTLVGSSWLSRWKACHADSHYSGRPLSSRPIDPSQLTLSECAFNEVLRDESVQCILDELDVNLGTDTASIFRIFRKDREGHLPLSEMLAPPT
ncbi:unnamed protein product, partial [Prorocentrum cordatum]